MPCKTVSNHAPARLRRCHVTFGYFKLRVTVTYCRSLVFYFFVVHAKCHDCRQFITPQGGHFQHVEAQFSCLFFFISVQFQRKTAPVFEQAKTSGCTLANHVISECIYPNKAGSNTIPLWLPDGFCIIHLDPYNNTGSLGAIFRFPRFPCRDTTLSGWAQSFSLTADVTCINKHSWVLVSDS